MGFAMTGATALSNDDGKTSNGDVLHGNDLMISSTSEAVVGAKPLSLLPLQGLSLNECLFAEPRDAAMSVPMRLTLSMKKSQRT